MKQMSSNDGQLIHVESADTPEHIATLTLYDQSTAEGGVVRFKQILRTFETSLDKSPIFTNKIVKVPFNLDQPYWVQDPLFDLEYHIRHIALPQPGDWRQLCIQVSRLHSLPLDLTRPLWQAYVIEGLKNVEGIPDNAFAVYIKVHHAAVDGMAFADFYGALHDFKPITPKGEYGSIIDRWKIQDEPSGMDLLAETSRNAPQKSFSAIKDIAKMVPDILRSRRFAEELDYEGAHSKPMTQFDGPISRNRVFNSTQFPLADIKQIKNSVPGATVNDVAVAIVSTGIRDYFQQKRILPEKSLVGILPVSVRAAVGSGQTGNEFNLIAATVHTDIEDPHELLTAVQKTTSAAKEYRSKAGPDAVTRVTSLLPAPLQRYLGDIASISARMGGSAAPGNFTVSNVPGSPVPLYLAGAKAIRCQGIGVLQHGHGLFHVVSSYCDEFTLSMLSCREQMPDPQYYIECINNAFEKHKKAAAKALERAVNTDTAETTKTPLKAVAKKAPTKKAAAHKAPAKKPVAKKAATKKPETKV